MPHDEYDNVPLPDEMVADREVWVAKLSKWNRFLAKLTCHLVFVRLKCGACSLEFWRDRKKLVGLPRGLPLTPICPRCNPIRGKTAVSVPVVE